MITVDTTGSAGNIYEGALKFKVVNHDLKKIPKPKTKVMVNVAVADSAFEVSFLPNDGVGLAREEFIIASKMGLHPMALLNMKDLTPVVRARDRKEDRGLEGSEAILYRQLRIRHRKDRRGVLSAQSDRALQRFQDERIPHTARRRGVRTKGGESDVGWRGASRYYDPKFKPAFMMEAAAMKMVREEMGLTNVIPMVPFCRTVDEGIKVQETMAEAGLVTNYMARIARAACGHEEFKLGAKQDDADLCDVRDPIERAARGQVPRYL